MIILPNFIDKMPNGKITRAREIGEDGYHENVEFALQLSPTKAGFIIVNYYGEDDSYLSQKEIEHIIKNTENLI